MSTDSKQKSYRGGAIVVGTHFYDGGADAMRRQDRAMDALGALTGIVPVDLQWRPRPARRPYLRVVPSLTQDSTTVTGADGKAKPIASDVFDALAAVADAEGCSRFLFFNSDIILTQAAIDFARQAVDGCAYSRLDVDGQGQPLGITVAGIDTFAIDVAWWRAHRQLFRPYILGEGCWDNVYAAIVMTRGQSLIENRDGLTRHEAHPAVWGAGPFAEHNGMLAALDSRYFTLWAKYYHHLSAARARGASADEERAIADTTFVWKRSPVAAIRHAVRTFRTRVKYRRRQSAWRQIQSTMRTS